MSKARSLPQVAAPVPPSRLVWSDEKLDALDKDQLANLLQNLQRQLQIGRVSADAASELEGRIRARLPVRAGGIRRKRPAATGEEGADQTAA
jgi:hypothetical protein